MEVSKTKADGIVIDFNILLFNFGILYQYFKESLNLFTKLNAYKRINLFKLNYNILGKICILKLYIRLVNIIIVINLFKAKFFMLVSENKFRLIFLFNIT